MLRSFGFLVLSLGCVSSAYATGPDEDDVDNGLPADVLAAKAKLERAAMAKAKAIAFAKKRKAAKTVDAKGKKVQKAKKSKTGLDLKSTTTPGANLRNRIKAAAEAEASKAPTEAPEAAGIPADESETAPKWVPATDAQAPTGHDGRPLSTQEWSASRDISVGYPMMEHHGYFRTRLDMLHNFDLDTYSVAQLRGTSPVLPPLTELGKRKRTDSDPNAVFDSGSDTLSSANIRLRYDPTLHVNENIRVRATMDILDNLVLGSTPDGVPSSAFSRPDAPIETFTSTQRPPESGVNGYRDSIRVKRVWGEWRNLLGLTMVGRMPSHWGLGLLANSGNCLDCDFGDSVDRIMHVTKLFDTYLALSWDFPSEGFVGYNRLHDARNQPYGQAHDFDQRDDVNEWVIALFDRPVTKRELETRQDVLNRQREPVFDWGVYSVVRNQALSSEVPGSVAPTTDAEVNLLEANAFAFIPDVWLNFEYRPRRHVGYHLQFEAVGVLGTIEELPLGAIATRPEKECSDRSLTLTDCTRQGGKILTPRKREIQQWGYALEFDARNENLEWGFQHGAASGDKTDGFGVLDKTPIDPTDSKDTELTAFRFDRDYIVDLILFREIIGAVTNAVYFKPWMAYNFVDEDDVNGLQREKWGFKLSAMYAQALEAKATPGNEGPLGLEFDAQLYIHEMDRFQWTMNYGILFPMGAFDRLSADETEVEKEPGIAQTLQMTFGVQF